MKKQWKQIGREILFGLPVAAGVILIIPALAGILDGRGWASAGWLALSVALLIAPVYVEDKLVDLVERVRWLVWSIEMKIAPEATMRKLANRLDWIDQMEQELFAEKGRGDKD